MKCNKCDEGNCEEQTDFHCGAYYLEEVENNE